MDGGDVEFVSFDHETGHLVLRLVTPPCYEHALTHRVHFFSRSNAQFARGSLASACVTHVLLASGAGGGVRLLR